MTVVVRSTADPLELVGSVRAELLALDPNLPISNVRTMEDVLAVPSRNRIRPSPFSCRRS
jgi:hypothetical protein